jgi:hypothetical protein
MFGCLSKRRFRRVDFPVPEGPDTTIGRSSKISISYHTDILCIEAILFYSLSAIEGL